MRCKEVVEHPIKVATLVGIVNQQSISNSHYEQVFLQITLLPFNLVRLNTAKVSVLTYLEQNMVLGKIYKLKENLGI